MIQMLKNRLQCWNVTTFKAFLFSVRSKTLMLTNKGCFRTSLSCLIMFIKGAFTAQVVEQTGKFIFFDLFNYLPRLLISLTVDLQFRFWSKFAQKRKSQPSELQKSGSRFERHVIGLENNNKSSKLHLFFWAGK